jgi:transcriptional regulator with XRE-family HTH domain
MLAGSSHGRGEGPRSYLAEFCRLLAASRQEAGLTVRQLAKLSDYSHPHVARATTGKKLPSWPLVRSYLNACGVGGEVLAAWWQLWQTTKSAEQELRKPLRPTESKTWYWELAEKHWQAGLKATRKPDPMLSLLEQVTTLEDLGVAITALAGRNGSDSLRQVEAETGIPRTTLHAWQAGRRKPPSTRLDQLVVALGATSAEQREFARCLERISDAGVCNCLHPPTGQRCFRGEYHKGEHCTGDGFRWLEDGVLDGVGGPDRWLAAKRVQPGPYW